MSSSGELVGTRKYVKTKAAKPQVTRDGVAARVSEMLDAIRSGGEEAAEGYARALDGYGGAVVLQRASMEAATASLPASVKADIRRSHGRIQRFAKAQLASMSSLDVAVEKGLRAGHKLIPLECAGCYVPGGRFAHVASALMTVTTAKAAGVKFVVACSPPNKKFGTVHPAVQYALLIAGADVVLVLGGVQALASMAFGLFTGKKADIVVGPGNRFVVEAKRQLIGECGIDLIAGPTEICIVADSSADPEIVATDLVSQAEHGPDSPCVLVTTDPSLADVVKRRVPELIETLPEYNQIAKVSWRDYGEIIVVDTNKEMAEVSDEIGSEHLEVHCRDLDWWHATLRNYGSLFLGEETTVSFGDKSSGPNHVLPTRRASRYTGGLFVGNFVKTVSWQRMTREATKDVGATTARISRVEGMEGHARSADVRLKKYFPLEKFDLFPPSRL